MGPSKPFACAVCKTQSCFRGDLERQPVTCPNRQQPELAHDPAPYLAEPLRTEMRIADELPFDELCQKRSRVEELVAFAKEHGMRRLGIAYCVTLTEEAQALGRTLAASGLEAELVCCRVGALDRAEVDLPKKNPEKYSSSCNPVAQAKLLDARDVQLIVAMGLCLGHDLILQKEARAPVTTLVVKDRVHANDPLAALRSAPRHQGTQHE